MSIDDHYIYVFVRQDISLPEQLVHATHAAYHMGNTLWPIEGIPSLVMVGIPHVGSLVKVVRKLKESDIKHHVWSDPDTEYGPTAIATEPLSHSKKNCLANYRLWAHSPAAATEPALSLDRPAGEAKADIAQLREHSVSNGEVVGANPAVGSINCS